MWKHCLGVLQDMSVQRNSLVLVCKLFVREGNMQFYGIDRNAGCVPRHLFTTQRVEHLMAILRHALHPTLTGKLLTMTMEEMQLEMGLSKSFLSYSHQAYGCLATCSWIEATWQFLLESSITFVDPFTKPALASEHDKFLMESFADAGYRGNDLRRLNECCLHIHALHLSDVCSADGH
jgi:hypothetical protein